MDWSPNLFAEDVDEDKPYELFNNNNYPPKQMATPISIDEDWKIYGDKVVSEIKERRDRYFAKLKELESREGSLENPENPNLRSALGAIWQELQVESDRHMKLIHQSMVYDPISQLMKTRLPSTVNKPGIKECLRVRNRQLKAEGKPLLLQLNKLLPVKLKAWGKSKVLKLIAECAKTPSLSNVGVHYWKTWLRVVSTDWDSKPDPKLTKTKIISEKSVFYRRPSPLVAGSVFAVVEAKKEYKPIKKFAQNKTYIDERRQFLKHKYLKQRKEVCLSKNHSREVLVAKIRMINH